MKRKRFFVIGVSCALLVAVLVGAYGYGRWLRSQFWISTFDDDGRTVVIGVALNGKVGKSKRLVKVISEQVARMEKPFTVSLLARPTRSIDREGPMEARKDDIGGSTYLVSAAGTELVLEHVSPPRNLTLIRTPRADGEYMRLFVDRTIKRIVHDLEVMESTSRGWNEPFTGVVIFRTGEDGA